MSRVDKNRLQPVQPVVSSFEERLYTRLALFSATSDSFSALPTWQRVLEGGFRRGASVASSLWRQNTNLRALATSGRSSNLKSRRLAAHFEPWGYFFNSTNLP